MSKDIKKAVEHCIEWACVECPNGDELGSGTTVCRGRLLTEVLKYVSDLEAKLAERERQYETLYKLFSEQHEIIDQNELECFEEVNRLLKEQKDFYIVEKAEYDKMKQGAKDIVNELKQQLAESEEKINMLEEHKFYANNINQAYADKCKNYEKQLAEKDAEVQNWKDGTMVVKLGKLEQQLAEKEKEIEKLNNIILISQLQATEEQRLKIIGSSCCQYNPKQDKIDFAVDELEKVKEFCNQREKDFTYLKDEIKCIDHNKWVDYIEELRFIKLHIDQQINELKERK